MSIQVALDASVEPDGVSFTVNVTNAGDEAVELTFPDACLADVAVERDGTVVWRWRDARMFTQMLQTERLAPGESLTYEATWDNPEPGVYDATATLRATDHDGTAITTVTV